MPLVRIALNKKPAPFARGIADAVHLAMTEVLGIPVGDRFQIITEHEAGELLYDASFYGIERTDGFVVIQVALAAGRTREVKTMLYRRIAELLKEHEVRPQDVFVSLLEVAPEDFSLGDGKAQFADALPPHLQALG